jgi:N-acetylmuramoyl-L-alanine amidase
MKDYYKLLPDKTRLLTRHFNRGRAGIKPNLIVRHHFAGIGDTDWLWNVWQSRQASAHYGVESGTDTVGQLVWDDNTAWHAANLAINRRSFGIEHGNTTGRVGNNDNHPDSWKIADSTIKGGARLAAAICLKYGMGKPEWGKNVADHRLYTGTSCPLKLARGGIYDGPWFEEATWFYDQLDKKLVHPDGTPIKTITAPPKKEHTTVSDHFGPEQSAALHETKVNTYELRGLAESIENQLLGPTQDERAENDRNPNGGRGWPQLGHNQDGQWLTVVDGLAALRQDVARLTDLIKENRNG